ncbi:MAG: hypothetical protein IJQ08_06025 [Synergistaceae bacterium]|nr:hypothetical protein [Synergistaceae bacterium]MBR0168209.1 hypothetical protein [Synergistaceae bacterium]
MGNFKKFVFAFLLVAIFATAAPAYNLNFRLVNQTGMVMYRLYMNPSEFGRFDFDQDEITGAFPMGSGRYTDISIRNPSRQHYSHWDMRIFFQDSNYISIYNVNLSRISTLTIDGDGDVYDNLGGYYNIKINE